MAHLYTLQERLHLKIAAQQCSFTLHNTVKLCVGIDSHLKRFYDYISKSLFNMLLES